MRASEVRSCVFTEESLEWVSLLYEESGFVAHTFHEESKGNDPRCPLVMTNVRNEDRRKKPATNVAHGRYCSWEKPVFSLDKYPLSP